MFKVNKFGERQKGAYNTPEHQAIAGNIAEEAIVLLKNDQILPLQKDNIKKLAVVGANATRKHAGGAVALRLKLTMKSLP